MADLTAQTIPVPYDGLDTDSAPEAISDTRAPLIQNFLVDRLGQLPMRGPINELAAVHSAGNGRMPYGPWIFNDKLLLGYREIDATKKRDPWTTPYRTAAAGDLSSGALLIKHIDLLTGTVTDVVPGTVNPIPGPRGTRLGAHVYGPAFDTSTAAVTENGTAKKLTSLLRWDGTAAAPTVYTNAPRGAQDIRAHYQRLLVLGGRNPDGTGQIQSSTLWWSDLIAGTTPLPDLLIAWQDDVSALTNQIIVGSDDPSDFGVGIAKVGGNAVIFKRRSMHLLLGYSPSTWTIKTFSEEIGCIDARSIVEYDSGCFFMSERGYMYFDGSSVVNVSRDLRTSLLAAAIAAVGDRGADGGRAVASRLPNDYIGISIGVSESTSSASTSTTTFCGMYHAPRNAWVNLSSDALTGSYPTFLARATTRTFVLDDSLVIQANKLTTPEQEVAPARGMDTVANLFRWDAGCGFTGTGNTLKSGAGIECFPSGSTVYAIPSKFKSKLLRLSSPLNRSQLHRLLLDYSFVVDGVTTPSGAGWYARLDAGDLTALLTEFQAPASGGNNPSTYRRRAVRDVFAECNDVQLTVEWRGTAQPLAVATVFPSVIEFQAARLRPTE